MSMQNMQNKPWASGVYNNIKKLVFSEIKLYVIIECKLTLISLTKTIVNGSLFFQKNL